MTDRSMLVASRYNTFTPSARPDTFLAFNVFTGALLELDERDYASISVLDGRPGAPAPESLAPALVDRLTAAGVLVPRGFDERAALFDIRRRSLEAPDTLLLTLAPTIQCNFRCTYCFEAHRQEAMTPAIEADLMRFIARNAEGARAITTTWFGGEPLLRPDVVERVQRFTNSLGSARGLSVTRGIVTNGYFLSEEMVRRLQALGDWKTVQVTIDGMPELHDTRRVLVGGQGTWARVVQNTRRSLDLGLPVSVRINVDRRNAGSLPKLIDRLVEEDILPRALVTLGFIVDSTGVCAHVKEDVLSDEDRARLTIWFDAELLRRGLLPSAGLPSPLCGPMCSVESKLGFVIAPSGLVFKCWNQIDRGAEEAIGHISDLPVPNAEAEVARWQRYDPSTRQGCSNCNALPTCMGGCPWEYERLARVHRGECDTFRFFPKEVVQLAHVRLRTKRGVRQPAAAIR
jgi:uncharacterized protein